ncbi:MAG: hypothetical protein MI673_03485, partial [Thiotrichales bacterium]|nr:hypothetical protein [Thiotrichales bacterium]
LEALERQLEETLSTPTTSAACSGPEDRVAPVTPAGKIELFRSLFRGRRDVFPTRFVSKKTGKSGYAPACANKFVRGICELPRVKCGECPNQAFHAADDQAIANHLRGRHVMGVYPLSPVTGTKALAQGMNGRMAGEHMAQSRTLKSPQRRCFLPVQILGNNGTIIVEST